MGRNEPDPEEWKKKREEERSSDSIRESTLEGDEASEYIQGAILEASKSEEVAAEADEDGRVERWLSKMADSRTPELLYYMNPFNYDRIDWIFAASFLAVITGGVMLFFTRTVLMTIASLVGMFMAFCVMLLCVGIEDLLKKGYRKLSLSDIEEETEEFQGGESFEEEKGQRQ